jgi:hypothetical protein
MKSHAWYLRVLAGLLLLCLLQSSAAGPAKVTAIQPCGPVPARSLPIKKECVAAAIAEAAFLARTQHAVKEYWISPMKHSATHWYFMILLGSDKSPPPPGGHDRVTVDRATGKAEVTPGE